MFRGADRNAHVSLRHLRAFWCVSIPWLIGGMWACEASLIGSGWLFGALYASMAADPAALLAWLIVGAIFAVLALVYSELGPI